jgi:hypothetical protein
MTQSRRRAVNGAPHAKCFEVEDSSYLTAKECACGLCRGVEYSRSSPQQPVLKEISSLMLKRFLAMFIVAVSAAASHADIYRTVTAFTISEGTATTTHTEQRQWDASSTSGGTGGTTLSAAGNSEADRGQLHSSVSFTNACVSCYQSGSPFGYSVFGGASWYESSATAVTLGPEELLNGVAGYRFNFNIDGTITPSGNSGVFAQLTDFWVQGSNGDDTGEVVWHNSTSGPLSLFLSPTNPLSAFAFEFELDTFASGYNSPGHDITSASVDFANTISLASVDALDANGNVIPGVSLRLGDGTLLGADGFTPAATAPEPSTLIMLGTGLVGAAGALRRRLTKRICLGLLCLAAWTPTHSFADELPPIIANQFLTIIGGSGTSCGGCGVYTGLSDNMYFQPSNHSASNTGFGPNITVSAFSETAGVQTATNRVTYAGSVSTLQTADSRTQIQYEFEILGPSGLVATDFGSSGSVLLRAPIGTPAAESVMTLFEQGNATPVLTAYACAGDTSKLVNKTCSNATNPATSFNISGPLMVEANIPYIVTLFTESYFSASVAVPNAEVYATIDPTITLATDDPRYSLIFSPGVIPDAAAPEPSSIALLGTGLVGIAGAARRRLMV